jgi:hypothetical protein
MTLENVPSTPGERGRMELPPGLRDQIIQNPVSFIGSARRIWGLGYGSRGWVAALRWTGTVLLVLLAWIGVLAWYALLTAFGLFPWLFWGIWTVRRRHFIYDARRHGRPIGGTG